MSGATVTVEAVEQRRAAILRAAASDAGWPRAAHSFVVSASGEFLEDPASRLAWHCEVRELFVHLTPVHWEQRDTAIGPVITLPIPAPPVATPEPDAAALDLRRARDLLATLRPAEALRRRLRRVAATDDAEVSILHGQVPRRARDAAGRLLDPLTPLRALTRGAVEVAAMLRDLERHHAEVGGWLPGAIARHRAAVAALAVSPTAAGLDRALALGVPPLELPRQADAERLDALAAALDALAAASAEVAEVLGMLRENAHRHVRAVARVVAEVTVREATATLARLRAQAEALRTPTDAQAMAREACSLLHEVPPTVGWPADPFTPPSVG